MTREILLLTGALSLLLAAFAVRADAARGQEYFESMNGGFCTSCHRVDGNKLVGPGLRDVTRRHTDEWLKDFLSDLQGTWKADHPETLELKKRVRKTRVPVTACKKNPMEPGTLDDLIAYLKTLEE